MGCDGCKVALARVLPEDEGGRGEQVSLALDDREGEGRGGKGREGEGRGGKGREGEGMGREGEGRGGKGREGEKAHVTHCAVWRAMYACTNTCHAHSHT